MNILLANSYFLERDANEQKIMKPYPPLGMLYVGAVLKEAGHTVSVFDGTFSRYEDFGKALSQEEFDLVGIYANVITREVALRMVRETADRGLPPILGGPDATGDPEAYLQAGALAVVRGEGELTARDLAARIEDQGARGDLRDVEGLILLSDGKIEFTRKRDRINDLDGLPLPDRGMLDMEQYLKAWKNRHGYSSASLITSRGCPYHCTWCSKEIFGETFRQRSPGSVIEELRLLKESYDPDQIWFADDILTLNRRWTLELMDRIKEENLVTPFECLSRVDRVDEEVARSLKRAGCFRLWFGAESGSERIVKYMRKDFTVARVRESVKLTMDAGIETGLFILIGYPGEKLVDLLKTLRMLRALKAHYCGSSVAFPIKGTQFYDDVKPMLADDYSWSRRNENRMTFKGRYPALFYWFAVRLIHNWASFWSLRGRKDSLFKQLARALKFMVAGTGVVVLGALFDVKERFFPDPDLKGKGMKPQPQKRGG